MKKYIYLAILILFAALTCTCMFQCSRIGSLNNQLNTSLTNEMALQDRLTGAQNDMVLYSNTIINLKHSQDSVVKELMATKEKLKIKDKELLAMGSMNTTITVHDTCTLTDTLFVENIKFDTVLTDEWKTIQLGLRYPDSITVGCEVKSDKDVFVTKTREYVDEPHWFFICRWFQKKHDVIRVKVDEKNPFVTSQENVYIRIIEE
jgi:hypothetical protein